MKSVLESLKLEHAMNIIDDKALCYLNTIDDTEQYPTVHCAMGDKIYMYGHSSSSSAEAMNTANKVVREQTAASCVMEAKR
jgi:hypothetical protein